MNFYHFIFLLLFFFSSAGQNYDVFILYDSVQLDEVKRNLKSGSTSACAQSAYQMLLSQADNLLEIENPTVVDKTIDPPSRDKHDYLSISRYWWPDPEKENGLPWIRKDGLTNPDTQTDAVDRNRLGLMTTGVKYLSLAYYFTEDEQYAQKAISMLNTWFLEVETRMNPHLEYSQSVPGNPKGRRSGILDGRLIALTIPDAITILRRSSHWTPLLENGMKEWFTNYLDWLTESDLGREGAKQVNNHGSWYRLHVAVVSLFVGQQSIAEKMIYQARESLEYQLEDDGRQLHEIERTRSFFYSCFNLEPLIMLAQIGDRLGIDLWRYKSTSGKSLPLALDYLTQVIDGNEWPHPSKEDNKIMHLIPILHDFHAYFKDENYERLLEKAMIQLSAQDVSVSEKSDLFEHCLLDGIDLKFD